MIRCLQAALSSMLIGGALLALAVPAEAVLAGKNGQIVFTSGREGANDDQAQIYLRTVVGSSGGGTLGQPVGIPGVQNRHASWSPDRTQIVFAAGTPGTPLTEEYDIYVRDLIQNTITALDVTQIGDGLSSDHPAWSPDGTRISYEQQTVDNSTQRDIMVKTVGTAAPATPLTTAGPIEFKPAWSPDSSTIYYASQQATPPASNLDILKEPAGGGTVTPVANATGVDEYQPSISPDGSKICFTLQTTTGNSTTADIYTASLPGLTGLTNLSDDATKGDINCTWSPNGNLITYVNGTFSQGRLVLERSDDSEAFPAQLEDDVGSNNFDGNPDWAPDGSPDCPDSAVTTPPDTPITIQLECVDTGPLYERTDPNGFVANDGEPQNGTLSDSVPLGNPSTVVYTPNPGFTGTDSLVFTSFDDFGFGSDDGTVTINVRVPDDPGGGGGGGNAATCAGKAATITGTDGKDKLKGTKGNDVIAALAGRDSVKAGAGNDLVCGGGGRDKLDGGGGRDKLKGGPDRDSCKGGGGRDKAGCEIEKSVP